MIHMSARNRPALLSLAAAGALWGLTVPLSKLALTWLGPGWLTVARFAVATPLLAFAGRRGLREALVPRVALGGAVGFGAVIVLQNAGIDHTSVSHAAVIVGVVPVLVALLVAGLGRGAGRPSDWAGYALALTSARGAASAESSWPGTAVAARRHSAMGSCSPRSCCRPDSSWASRGCSRDATRPR